MGADTLRGAAGADRLTGEAGRHVMTGGLGADRFDFNVRSQTGNAFATRDRITDFSHAAHDKIDLRDIDANVRAPGNQNFRWIETHFTHHAGELNYHYEGDRTIVQGDVNGDARADFQIELTSRKVLFVGGIIL